MIGNFPAVLNFNRLFLELNRFICNYLPVLSDHSFAPEPIAFQISKLQSLKLNIKEFS